MKPPTILDSLAAVSLAACAASAPAFAQDQPAATNPGPAGAPGSGAAATLATTNQPPADENWNWHFQNTFIGDIHPAFHSSIPDGPNSMHSYAEQQETVSADLFAGVRLWKDAEFHVDGLFWQGYGFSRTLGAEAFPNAEAYRVGTEPPNVNFARVFFRQVIGLGGDQETVADDETHLAETVDVSRITLTVGKISVIDIFDNNAYAGDGRRQFMNWALVTDEAWDYPADSLGYTTGLAAELNQPHWTARYGFFQMPKESNGVAQDEDYLQAWGMVVELERRYQLGSHPGTVRLLGYMNQAHMGRYEDTLDNPSLGMDITQTREYRRKYGGGINVEQELTKGLGAFARAGWSDGTTEGWVFSDVDESASAGFSLNGAFWNRPDDTVGLAGVVNGITSIHQQFFEAGGTGILAGDGSLNYGIEGTLETYYDFKIWATLHGSLDYQLINNPSFNRDRGPIDIFSLRLHWEL
jgi:high affinity Mn2+ porin